jgi:glycosyltransferase involved in cell wall biosynthesis
MTAKPLISVVVPAYNEAEGIAHFHERATAAMQAIADCDYEFVYVDDGSKDGTYDILNGIAKADSHAQVIKFSRNFLQDPPELIAEMVAKWREGNDVVYARRAVRKGETPFKLVTAAVFYRLLRSIANIDIPPDVGDFRLISARVADQLRAMREKDRFIRGLVSWVGFRQTYIMYERDERYAGETKYPLTKMIKFALDGLTSFSSAPLRVATWMGYIASALAFLYLLSVFVQVALGITVEGWATIIVAVLFLGGVQLICLGILGEYLGRVFNEVKPRPVYIVEEIAGGRAPAARETKRPVARVSATADKVK